MGSLLGERRAWRAPVRLQRTGLAAAARGLASPILLGVVPAIVVTAFLASAVRHEFGFDFRTFWHAGGEVLAGRSPYVSPHTVAVASSRPHDFFVYPPVLAVALVPLAPLPFGAASAIFVGLLVGCLVGALRVLGVRDWRCYAVTLAAFPTLSSLRLGAITPVLVLALAVGWRYRSRWVIAGGAVGAAMVLKLFVWPLLVWLLVTRRYRAALTAVLGAGAAALLSWSLLGFDGLQTYPALLRALSGLESSQGFSTVAAVSRLRLPSPELTGIALAVPAVGFLLVFARRAETGARRDSAYFAACVVAALLLTPILWLHYFALLLLPIAIRRQRFGREWLLLLCFWISPYPAPDHLALWRITLALGLATAGARIAPRPTLSRLPGGKP